MKINVKQVLSGILVSSLASISNAYVSSGTGGDFTTLVSSLVSSGEEKKKGRHTPSFILPASNCQMLLAARGGGHRSHSSHSSHRSGSSGRGSSHFTRSTSTRTTTSSPYASSAPTNDYKLGDREIFYGMSGRDVTQLAELLIMHNYLAKQETVYKKYSTQMRQAVIAFQMDARIPATGICDRETIYKLQNWDRVGTKKKKQSTAYPKEPSSTTSLSGSAISAKAYKLGDREICDGMSGSDIRQLAALLIMYDYLKPRSDYEIYSKPVRDAVILFQKDAGLPATGVCDSMTIKKLQDWDKILAKKKEEARLAGYQERQQQTFSQDQKVLVTKKYQLGDRSLKIGSSGPDVDKLIGLLIKFKFLPQAPEINFYDLAVYEAVKKAQVKLKIEPSGVADYITVRSLQEFKGE